MTCTMSHTKSISPEDYSKFQIYWSEFIKQEISVWRDFYLFWLSVNIPIHIIKFEDILANPKKVFTGVMSFLLNKPDISGTVIEKYIDLAVSEKAPEIYKPRSGTSNISKDKFIKEDLDYIYAHA